jgi:hypothetical protein
MEFTKVEGLEAKTLLEQAVRKISMFPKLTGNNYQGTHELPDGRVIEGYCEFNWFNIVFVFENRAAWESFKPATYRNRWN